MPILIADADRIVTWTMDANFVVEEQYLLVTVATNNTMDLTKIHIPSTATSYDLSSFGKFHKILVKLEQVSPTGDVLKSSTITLPALQIPHKPTLVTVIGINDGLVASFNIDANSPLATQVVMIVTDLDDMATIEKTMPQVKVNGQFQVTVTSADMALIQANANKNYEVSLLLRNNVGDSEVSIVLSATPTNLPNAPTLLSVSRDGNDVAAATWSPPNDSAYWTATNVDIFYYKTVEASTLLESQHTKQAVTPVTATMATITGLTNGTSYSFYVKYSNSYGLGEKSNTMTFTPYGLPDPVGDFIVDGYINPTNLASYQSNPRNLQLNGTIITSRTTPNARPYTMNANGATITGFNIYNELGALLTFVPFQSLPSGVGQGFNFSGALFGDDITPLGSTFTYGCRTVAITADGVTVLSNLVNTTFTLHSNSLPVTNLIAIGLDQAINLSWNASITKGKPILRYSIRDANNFEVFNTQSTTYTIPNLINGVANTFSVVAVTESDRLLANTVFSTVETLNNLSVTATPFKAPVINSVSINNLTMTLNITANGLPATNVTVFAVDSNSISAFIQEPLVNNQVSFTGTQLTNIASYMVFVTNSAGKMSNIMYQVASS